MFSLIYDATGTKNMQEKNSILGFTCHKFSFAMLVLAECISSPVVDTKTLHSLDSDDQEMC